MLKIYLRTIKYEIHNEDKIINLKTYSHYTIRDEESVAPKTKEFGAYTNEAQKEYGIGCGITQKRKGKEACYEDWLREVYLQEWTQPDAKLVERITYKEKSCSMRDLFDLPADKVIAYLKQEGMNLIMPS